MTDSFTAAVAGAAVGWVPPVPTRSVEVDALDRMILTADGTVTTLLEACTGESILTRTTRQAGPATFERIEVGAGRWWHPDSRLLGLAPSECMIARRVTLRGTRSGVAFVLAESLVAPDRLPDGLADGLLHAGASLGRLLSAGGLETRRTVLDIELVRAGDVSDYLGVEPGATLARRTYTIVVGGQAVAAVTEWLAPGRLTLASTLARPSATDGCFHDGTVMKTPIGV